MKPKQRTFDRSWQPRVLVCWYALCVVLLFPQFAAAGVLSMTGSTPTLLSFDADTLDLTGGTATTSSSVRYDLAFDGSGRLFGIGKRLLEFDPSTLTIVNERAYSGNMHGLAATAVPEPSSLALLGIGAVGMAVLCRRKKRVAA